MGVRKIDSCSLAKQSLIGGLIAAYRKQLGGSFKGKDDGIIGVY